MIEYPFRALIQSLRAKDADLYESLKRLAPSQFVAEWRKAHPEDFVK